MSRDSQSIELMLSFFAHLVHHLIDAYEFAPAVRLNLLMQCPHFGKPSRVAHGFDGDLDRLGLQ
jgi:hypothetical protein